MGMLGADGLVGPDGPGAAEGFGAPDPRDAFGDAPPPRGGFGGRPGPEAPRQVVGVALVGFDARPFEDALAQDARNNLLSAALAAALGLAGFVSLFWVHNNRRWQRILRDQQAMDRLLKHSWPGNVRELENAVERAVVLLVGDYISERELPPTIVGQEAESAAAARVDFANMTLEEIERMGVLR